jgi:peptidoglycan/xylan/chitin deacetylase (PgdA/CDA1 family)
VRLSQSNQLLHFMYNINIIKEDVYMLRLARLFILILLATTLPGTAFADKSINIPILCYHNLNPSVRGSMNLTPEKFEAQLKYLKDNGYHVISLKEAVDYLQGARSSLPAKSVVITADDGWQSVYKYMYPLARKYNMPITLFIYPETISTGKNAMTWAELKELQQTGLFDIQGHTYWHPNFKQEKRRLSDAAYQQFVQKQLVTSKNILEEKLNTKITLLAWPFGIYNPYLEQQAASAGYTMAFSIDARVATKKDRAMAQPRFMIVDGQSMKTFMAIVNSTITK